MRVCSLATAVLVRGCAASWRLTVHNCLRHRRRIPCCTTAGKYNNSIPAGTRLAQPGYEWLQARLSQWHKEGKIEKVKQLTKFAQEEVGCSVAQLALAWCVRNENVTTVLLGATKPSQLEENLGAIEVARRLTGKHMAAIEEILGNKPPAFAGYGGSGGRTFPKLPSML